MELVLALKFEDVLASNFRGVLPLQFLILVQLYEFVLTNLNIRLKLKFDLLELLIILTDGISVFSSVNVALVAAVVEELLFLFDLCGHLLVIIIRMGFIIFITFHVYRYVVIGNVFHFQ